MPLPSTLQTPSTIQGIFFSDLPDNFNQAPNSGDLAVLTNVSSIKQSLKNIVMTGLGERPYNDSIGSPGQMGLFEIGDYPTTTVVQQQLLDAIRINEPRVTIQEIIMDNNQDNFLIVRIFFLINNLPGNYSLEVSVKRVR